ncbi:MAG: hypothetical protein HZA61_02675 [Candidatus Eisenbacteria bacterium]|uniref:DUF4397 domain-containing protein n=1 Tax=Eiseniibacteriota bacterium TaxID=2212470 RepID=A0A933SE80_UNCEI|nr:hypothetical protein [Candidatus Eisenbacteria bacterium]
MIRIRPIHCALPVLVCAALSIVAMRGHAQASRHAYPADHTLGSVHGDTILVWPGGESVVTTIQLLVGTGNSIDYIPDTTLVLASGETLRVTPTNPSGAGDYVLPGDWRLSIGNVSNPRLVNIWRYGRPALLYSNLSSRDVVALVQRGEARESLSVVASASMKGLVHLHQASRPGSPDADWELQVVRDSDGQLELPEGWSEMTVQFLALRSSSRARTGVSEPPEGREPTSAGGALASPSSLNSSHDPKRDEIRLLGATPIGRPLVLRARPGIRGGSYVQM